MRHVDEGTIHAWLDDQITDPAEAAWIEEHLRWCADCAARLAEERATLEQADALLSVAAPATEPPAFGELVAKVGNPIPETTTASVAQMAHGRRWLLQAGWAASLALAVGIGWTARELADREPVQSSLAQEERRPGVTVNPPDTVAARPAVAPPASTAPARDVISSTPGLPGRLSGVPPVERPAAASRRELAPSAPPQTPQQAANAALPPSALDPQVESARRDLEAVAGASAASARQALAPPAAAPVPAAPPPLLERVTVTAEAPARPVVTQSEWQPLPRTEAAARSGMPLYGIDGLEPTLTSISPDGRIVRTVYRLESGPVELEQQRAISDTAPAAAVQAARSALTSRGRAGIVGDAASAVPRQWSGVRGDVRLTLRTQSVSTDLDTLGTKLRVD